MGNLVLMSTVMCYSRCRLPASLQRIALAQRKLYDLWQQQDVDTGHSFSNKAAKHCDAALDQLGSTCTTWSLGRQHLPQPQTTRARASKTGGNVPSSGNVSYTEVCMDSNDLGSKYDSC